MNSGTCTVAFVGAGSMAREHLKAFQDVPGVALGGIHSRTRARAEALAAEFGVGGVHDSIDQLYAETKADLVVVAVPELSTHAVCHACFDHPWTLLVEKPVGFDFEDASAIAKEARDRGRNVRVGLNRRFYSSTRAAREDLDRSSAPRFIHVQDQQNMAAALAAGQPELVVRNWMYANSIHLVDYLRVFGRGSVTAVTPVFAWNASAPGVVLVTVEFASGDTGLYEGIWHGPGPWAVTVTTAERRWEMRPLEQATFQNAGERRRNDVEMHAWDREFKAGFRLQAEEVVRAVRREPSIAPTIAEALETMTLVKAIFAS